ncbi:unnamed protein product [Symbiodinium sp. CCMP2592]|nr:unnamed protein product [Symbiodinium sp. CCMP2592]
MCIGTAENLVRRGPARKSRRPSLEELLTSAAEAARAAPNRAAKRRVRQRLHKKLGAMLTIEEFEQAMDRFQVMVEDAEEPRTGGQLLPRAGVSSVPVLLVPVATPMQVLRPQPPQPAPVNKQAFSQERWPLAFAPKTCFRIRMLKVDSFAMCLGVAEIESATAATVQEILVSAATASADAALKIDKLQQQWMKVAPDNGGRGRLKEVPTADRITIRQYKQRKDAVKNMKPKKKKK